MTSTYRNPWYRPGHFDGSPERFATDAPPVPLGKYTRFHRIKGSGSGSSVYDYVYEGVCFAQRAGAATEEEIDRDRYAQTNLLRFCGVAFGPTWDEPERAERIRAAMLGERKGA